MIVSAYLAEYINRPFDRADWFESRFRDKGELAKYKLEHETKIRGEVDKRKVIHGDVPTDPELRVAELLVQTPQGSKKVDVFNNPIHDIQSEQDSTKSVIAPGTDLKLVNESNPFKKREQDIERLEKKKKNLNGKQQNLQQLLFKNFQLPHHIYGLALTFL
eukprot:UN04237